MQILLGLFCIVLIFLHVLIYVPIFSSLINQLDNLIYDEMVQLNWRSYQRLPQIVIIDIDNKSVQDEGRWPWPRNKMADLINQLKKYGVVTIGMDIVMSEPETNYATGLKEELVKLNSGLSTDQKKLPILLDEIAHKVDNDEIFANSLLDHNVILGYLFHDDSVVRKGELPKPFTTLDNKYLYRNKMPLYQFSGYNGCLKQFLQASTQAGAVTNVADTDGKIRHGIMLESYNNLIYPSLALSTAMNYMMVKQISLKKYQGRLIGIQIGGVFIPTNSQGQILIPFWGPPGTLSYYSASDIIDGKIDPGELQGAIAIIGSTMILLADLHHSPVSHSFPGVEMVGNMIQGIISQQLVSPFDWHTHQARLYLVLIGVFFALLLAVLSAHWMVSVATISIFGILALSVFLFVSKNIYVSLAVVIILIAMQAISNYVYLFINERKQKRKINQLFGQYVPEEYVKELIESPELSTMEGQVRQMTVQFSDIRNFTSLSENLEASDVKRLLNTFFTPITEIIFSFRGTIDKYVGDMIVAFWGAPIYDEDHAFHALKCSLYIMQQIPKVNEEMFNHNLPEIHIGIGLASGLMNVGDMGSEFRRAYTVIGDTVNLASRLEELTKFYQISILVSEGTRENQDQFIWRTVDRITVKGRRGVLKIYQPLGIIGEVAEEIITELELYHQALVDYYTMNWSSAEKKFVMLKNQFPNFYLYQIYLDRIKEFMSTPPSEDWNGVFIHQHK